MGMDNTQTSQAGQSDGKMMCKCWAQPQNIPAYPGGEATVCRMSAEWGHPAQGAGGPQIKQVYFI